jgi:allantoin racemase
MNIAVISPILAPEHNEGAGSQRNSFRLRDCANIPADFTFHYIEEGPKFILNAYDDALAVPGLLRRAIAAERDGADAIVINCSADTGLRAVREAVSIPVFGPSETTMLYAAQLADRFCVLTFDARTVGRFERIADALGVRRNVDCIRSVELPFEEISDGHEKVVDALFYEIQDVFETRGCDGFMLGCTDFEDVSPELSERLKASNIDAVVLKPFEIAVHQAYITVLMGLKQGRKSYPAPTEIMR